MNVLRKCATASMVGGMMMLGISAAHATVVNFDDLTGSGTVADGYGGINWDSNWTYYDGAQDPYTPSSDFTRIYTNYDLHAAQAEESVAFYFGTGSIFDGAYFSGAGVGTVSFSLYLNSALVATSSLLVTTATPTFLFSGYAGLVDEVRVNGFNGYYVMDDVTYNETSPVPLPAGVWLLLTGIGGIAGIRKLRKA